MNKEKSFMNESEEITELIEELYVQSLQAMQWGEQISAIWARVLLLRAENITERLRNYARRLELAGHSKKEAPRDAESEQPEREPAA